MSVFFFLLHVCVYVFFLFLPERWIKMYSFRWVIFLLVRVCHNYWVIFVLHENKKNAERSLERLLNYIFGWLANTSVYSAFITPEIWPEAHPKAAKPNRTEPEVPNLVWSHISNPIVVATVRTQCCYGCAFVTERHRSVPTVDWRSYLETASAYNDCLLYSRSLLLRGKSASTQAAVTPALSLSVLSALVAASASRRFLRAVNKHNCSVTIRTTRCDRWRTPLKHEDLAVSREHTERQGGCDSGLSRCAFSMKKKRPTIQ